MAARWASAGHPVQRADKIFVLDAGNIVDSGTHSELVARGELYARLAALQFAT